MERQLGLNWSHYVAPGHRRSDNRLQLAPFPALEMYGWGATMVRVQFHEYWWLNDCPAVWAWGPNARHTTYQTAILESLTALTNLGVGCMLSLTATGRGRNVLCSGTLPDPFLKEMADRLAVGCWSEIAADLAGNDLVVLDLFNEPHRIDDRVWRDGGTVHFLLPLRR